MTAVSPLVPNKCSFSVFVIPGPRPPQETIYYERFNKQNRKGNDRDILRFLLSMKILDIGE